MAASAPKPATCEEDSPARTVDRAARLRALAHDSIDRKNAAAEIESSGEGDRRGLHGRSLTPRDSFSLRPPVGDVAGEESPHAIEDAVDETRMPRDTVPATCPFAVEAILDPDVFPEAA